MSSLPKDMVLTDVPDDEIAVGLWPASRITEFREEVSWEELGIAKIFNYSNWHSIHFQVLLYPFTSLLAEFGGCLGLFLGFSFVTLSDGVKGFAKWLKKNINYCWATITVLNIATTAQSIASLNSIHNLQMSPKMMFRNRDQAYILKYWLRIIYQTKITGQSSQPLGP